VAESHAEKAIDGSDTEGRFEELERHRARGSDTKRRAVRSDTHRWDRAAGVRAVVILVCVVAIYFPALGGGYLWDDDVYVTANVALRSAAGLLDIWRIPPATRQYYPVTFSSFWLEYRVWADSPLGYHIVNVVLHGINALLVWRLLAVLGVPYAFLAAWIFAVHPLHVESVAWIAERKNVLSALFALLATLAWVRFLADGRRYRLFLTGMWFSLALLSKTQVCVLPIILLLVTWWKRPERIRPALVPLTLLAGVGFAGALATVRFEANSGEVLLPMPQLDPMGRVLVAGRALWFYATSLFWPANLRAIYGHWAVDSHALQQFLFPLGAAVAIAILWGLRRRIGKGPFTAVAVFVLSLAPTLGFVDFQFMRFAFVGDHFAYLASIPLISLGVVAAGHAWARIPAPSLPAFGAGAIAFLIGGLGVISWHRAAVHSDAESLWRDTIRRDPLCAMAYNHLGSVLANRGRLDEAIAAFRAAVSIDSGLAEPQHNWGMALQQQGKLDEAIAQYAAALRLRPDSRVVRNSLGVTMQAKGEADAAIRYFAEAIQLDPAYAPAHNNWGTVLYARGDPAAAIEHFATAVRLRPAYAEAQDNWGVALSALGRTDEALAHFSAAVNLNPNLYTPHRHCGDALAKVGRYERAVEEYRAAILLAPSRAAAHRGLGIALLKLGRTREAIAALTTALTLDGSAESHHQLGVALSAAGRSAEALEHFAAAARLDPGNAEIQNRWGEALSDGGRFDDAVSHFSEAIRLRPEYAEARDNLAQTLASRDQVRRAQGE